jgi:hypothetical protein
MSKSWFERNPRFTLFIIIVVFFIILDFALGLIFIPYNYNNFRTLDPVYHHGLRPNQDALAAWGSLVYPFHTNSLGFRDSSTYKVPFQCNEKRILVLGDSHTEAVGISYEDSFFGILQKKAMQKKISMLNASAVSYSPKIYFLKTKYLLEEKKLKTDEIWVFIDLSDLQNELAYEPFITSRYSIFKEIINTHIPRFLKNHSLTWNTISRITDAGKVKELSKAVGAFNKQGETEGVNNTVELYSVFFKDFNDKELLSNPGFHVVGEWYYSPAFRQLADKGLSLGMENITRLNQLCQTNHIKLKLSVHPWQIQVMKQDTMDYYVQRWRDYCKAQNIDFINLFPIFINEENPEIAISKYYIPNDNHWSEAGHARVAAYLEKYLVSDTEKK